MPHMRKRSWNSAALAAALCVGAAQAWAQGAAGRTAAVAAEDSLAGEGIDALADALACRVGYERFPVLMEQLRRERPNDFSQTYRQYSAPAMDLYRLADTVRAWGQESDTILIADNRVMMAVEGSLDEVTARLDEALEHSSESPLSSALDDRHALVIFEAAQPGLQGMVLLGCEYRIPDVSLLDEPEDAWRKRFRQSTQQRDADTGPLIP